jgi:hypothetical protein
MECHLRRAKARLFLYILINSQTEGPVVSDSKRKGPAGDSLERNFQR